MTFGSDNVHGVDDVILDAIRDANSGTARAYGLDDWTAAAERRLRDVFECDLDAYLVVTGTAANSLALAACCPSRGAVVCHQEAHILVEECGAPELFTGGAKLVGVGGPGCKLTPPAVEAMLATLDQVGPGPRPSVLSLSQSTELGTVYTPAEVEALAHFARNHGMHVHVDGARFANALAGVGCTPAELSWKAGVDVLSFGATKNGALGVEAVIFFDRALAADFAYLRKRAGQVVSKSRFLGAQMLAYLDADRWRVNAWQANAMARRLAGGLRTVPGVRLPLPVEANAVFAIVPQALHEVLQTRYGRSYEWSSESLGSGVAASDEVLIRLVTSFRTSTGDVDAFIEPLPTA